MIKRIGFQVGIEVQAFGFLGFLRCLERIMLGAWI